MGSDYARPCPLCAARGRGLAFPFETDWGGRRFSYVACAQCACTFVDPLPTDDELARMYAREHYHDQHYAEDANGLRASSECEASVRYLRAHAGPRQKLLDFGCGTGAFLKAARLAGYEASGVEYHPSAIEAAAKASGTTVTDFETARAKGAVYDIVHLGDVFEHLKDPAETTRELLALLRPGGLLFLEGPLQRNASLVYFVAAGLSRVRRAVGLGRPGRTPPTHLILVDRHAQRAFFEDRFGLRTVHFEVEETGWPYNNAPGSPRSPGRMFKRAVARTAVALSETMPAQRRVLGNRFRALFQRP